VGGRRGEVGRDGWMEGGRERERDSRQLTRFERKSNISTTFERVTLVRETPDQYERFERERERGGERGREGGGGGGGREREETPGPAGARFELVGG
jgi:hypothetical protein